MFCQKNQTHSNESATDNLELWSARRIKNSMNLNFSCSLLKNTFEYYNLKHYAGYFSIMLNFWTDQSPTSESPSPMA